ncbi:hypothetical protein [Clostridium tyrobutyricum]|uniref:hypothetical protein n=1 Tax=Clostridium tyrobutyricum TaxID=1519 RepID=UPI00189C6F5A|nr:hypothetical protein [Clostridium tyrobutyricum]
MADYRKVKCPSCHDKDLGPCRIDLKNEFKLHGYCGKCHEQYTIVYGNGKIKAIKGNA